jgi:hypothetical protein
MPGPSDKTDERLVLDLVLIGLDPLPLTAFLVVLPSKRACARARPSCSGGWYPWPSWSRATCSATGNNPPEPSTAPSLAALAARIALGAVLVIVTIQHIRRPERPKPPKKPPSPMSVGPSATVHLDGSAQQIM